MILKFTKIENILRNTFFIFLFHAKVENFVSILHVTFIVYMMSVEIKFWEYKDISYHIRSTLDKDSKLFG